MTPPCPQGATLDFDGECIAIVTWEASPPGGESWPLTVSSREVVGA